MALRALKTEEEIAGIPLDQEILVELPSAVTGDEVVTETKKTEIDPAAKTLQDQLEALQKETADRIAKAERDAAEARRLAAERERELNEQRTRTQSLEGDIINGGLAGAQSERDAAKQAFKIAFEAGDAAAMAEAQSKIGRAEAKILTFESGAAEIAERKEVKPAQQEQVRQVVDPIAAMRANPNLLPKEKEWLEAHQDALFGARNNELSVGYERAMKKGLNRGTPEYFDFLEDFMGYKKPDNNSGDISVQAPPSRNERGSDGRPTNSNVIRLTAEEREFAKGLGITDLEYAKQKQNFDAARKADPDKYRGA